MAIVNTPAERARQYFQYRPTRVLLAADPEVRTHQAFGLPEGTLVADESQAAWAQGTFTMGQLQASLVNPTGELPEPQNVLMANETLNKGDGFELTEVDKQIVATHGFQLAGHFLIDPGRDHPVAADRGHRADRRPRQVPERRGDRARGPRSLDRSRAPCRHRDPTKDLPRHLRLLDGREQAQAPAADWVALARGTDGAGVSVDDAGGLVLALPGRALAEQSPPLIEARLQELVLRSSAAGASSGQAAARPRGAGSNRTPRPMRKAPQLREA